MISTILKRSEINRIIRSAKDFMAERQYLLPPWAFWSPEEWKGKYDTCSEIVDNMLGWDITDFGSNRFYQSGLFLFTLRNGTLEKGGKTMLKKE